MEPEPSPPDLLLDLANEILSDPKATRRERMLVLIYMRQDKTYSILSNLSDRVMQLEEMQRRGAETI